LKVAAALFAQTGAAAGVDLTQFVESEFDAILEADIRCAAAAWPRAHRVALDVRRGAR
jgi:hypothetical protein